MVIQIILSVIQRNSRKYEQFMQKKVLILTIWGSLHRSLWKRVNIISWLICESKKIGTYIQITNDSNGNNSMLLQGEGGGPNDELRG